MMHKRVASGFRPDRDRYPPDGRSRLRAGSALRRRVDPSALGCLPRRSREGRPAHPIRREGQRRKRHRCDAAVGGEPERQRRDGDEAAARRARIRMLPLLSGETPLMAASRAGKPVVVEQLLKKGASPNARATPRSDGVDVGRRAEARGRRQGAARGVARMFTHGVTSGNR